MPAHRSRADVAHWYRRRTGGSFMPMYVVLMTLTDEGVKGLTNLPSQVDAAEEALESAGGELIGFYLCMGRYDYVAIVDSPSDEYTMVQLLKLAMEGSVRTVTLKAFQRESLPDLVRKLD
jgi:uncharacterized protein with GYD domain